MYCPKCGGLNADSAPICTQCGENLQQANTNNQPNPAANPGTTPNTNPAYPNQVTAPKPESYLIWSILATLLCCPIPGIVSIVFAAQVDSRYNAGDVAGATDASNKAKTWAIVAAALGIMGSILYMVLFAGMAARR
jgi:uncharacterized membrane protein YvbJ